MLKSLDVFGFKSFADRTKFSFAPGITAVVGPNGSGKSNVVDSIKWILGDQSAKSLRGKEMLDVVFNGSAARKESQYAEAILTFDNTSGFLPVDQPEVSIGRRLWRTGDAEYLINGNAARLKDVRGLFLGTGAGTSAYAIIEQGRVDQILQANATNRRLVFEEAAGISRYKARRTEAERKLERVEQNLIRLDDLVSELGGRLKTLRGQAKRASRYQEVSTQLEAWWLGLVADDCRAIAAALSDEQASAELAAERKTEAEEALAALADRIREAEDDVTAAEERLYTLDREAASNREAIAEHRAALKYQAGSGEVIEREIATVRDRRSSTQAFHQEAVAELVRVREQMSRQQTELGETQARAAQRDAQMLEVMDAIEALSGELTTLKNAAADEEGAAAEQDREIQRLGLQQESLDSRDGELRHRVGELDAEAAQVRRLIADLTGGTEAAASAVRRAEAEQRAAADRLAAFSDDQERDRRTLAERREERSGCSAKIAVLEDLDRQEVGLDLGPKEILRRADDADYPPWNRIRGCVGDLLHAEGEAAALIDVALGSVAQYLVIEEFDSLVEYLASGTARLAGQVGFVSVSETGPVRIDPLAGDAVGSPHVLPLAPPQASHSEPRPLPAKPPAIDLSDEPGVVSRADRLCAGPEFWPSLPVVLLSHVWVVDRLATARRLADRVGPEFQFVTLQGEVWQAGRLQAGLPRADAGPLTRRSEIQRLRGDLTRLDADIVRLQERLRERQQRIEASRAEWETAEELTSRASEAFRVAQTRADEQQSALGRLTDERERITTQLNELSANRADLEGRAHALRGSRQQYNASLQTRTEAIAKLQLELQTRSDELGRVESEVSELRVKLGQQQERLTSLEDAHARLRGDLKQKADQQTEAAERWESIHARERSLTLQRLNTANELAECLVVKDRFDLKIGRLRSALTERKAVRAKLAAQEAELNKLARSQDEVVHQTELKRRELLQRRETLAERVDEEYQLTLDDVLASNRSAFGLYQQEWIEQHTSDAELGSEVDAEPVIEPDSEADSVPPIDWDAARKEIEDRVADLRRQARSIGGVSTDGLADLTELEARFGRLDAQLNDLREAKRTLEEIIRRINKECRRRFLESFETIRGYFQELFRKLFGGGEGDVLLEDTENVLDCGIEIVARPPGKELRSMSLLSGGEKTLTAVALLLAIFKSKPSPFCILDEVDAALDDANITRFVSVLGEFVESTQFVMITHRKPSMTVADVLYGVTMEEAGVSKKMSVRFDQVDDQGNFVGDSQAA